MLWMVLLADLLDYSLAGDEAYQTLTKRDREFRAGVDRLIQTPGYATLRGVVTGWVLHGHDELGFRELAEPREDGS
jgi:hypothetical protein